MPPDETPTETPTDKPATKPVVRIRDISKQFPGVKAVDGASLDVLAGEVHIIAGENGAGKSTLMKILAQAEKPTQGEIYLGDEKAEFHGPRYAQTLGIAMVYQEFVLAPHLSVTENLFASRVTLAPQLSVAENVFAGHEPGRLWLVNRRAERKLARELLRKVGLDVNPDRTVSGLTVAAQQRVEIAKALAIDAKVIIMDEPTATLAGQDVEELFALIEDLKAHGAAILYISHRMEEIFRIGDRVTILRDGKVVHTSPIDELDETKLVRLMVGRDVENLYPKADVELGEVMFRARGVSRAGVLDDCSFEARKGEILGFAGLVGAGRTELARVIFGADRMDSGTVEVDGHRVSIKTPEAAINAGIGYLTEDRKGEGLALELSVEQNITAANLPSRAGMLKLKQERSVARHRREQLSIRTPSLKQKVGMLSGGNQQKVVVAKWLETNARVLFFDEPTRGVDVGAKAEIFELMGELARQGHAVIFISSNLPELLNMCDRIVVMRAGKIVGEVEREDFSEERVIGLATGTTEEAGAA
jgi:ribose transport system ATP-binding protein